MSTPDPRIETIFHEVLTGAPAEREAFVAKACAGDEALQKEVHRLLAAHEEAGTYFERPNSPEIEAELARLKPEEEGERIGPYKLMEQIGEGGFGTVWVADQEQPVRRRVALKIIKMGMDTKEVIARFEQERQALAMMDHPHIAKVFDAGATQWGRPFFVMELVRGIKITDYCDQANLPTAERLALFIQVCNAVQHAHQKGTRRMKVADTNLRIVQALQAGTVVVLFAEGTSSDGRAVLPFRSSLLEPAALSQCPVAPAAIGYHLDDGSARDEVCYWRDMTLLPHLLNLFAKRAVRAHVAFGGGDAEALPLSRKNAALQLHDHVTFLVREHQSEMAAGRNR